MAPAALNQISKMTPGLDRASTLSGGVTSDDITRKILEAVPKDEKLK